MSAPQSNITNLKVDTNFYGGYAFSNRWAFSLHLNLKLHFLAKQSMNGNCELLTAGKVVDVELKDFLK